MSSRNQNSKRNPLLIAHVESDDDDSQAVAVRQKLEEQIQIAEALLTGHDRWVDVLSITSKAENHEAAVTDLCAAFDISEIGAHFVLYMTFSQITKVGRAQLSDDLARMRSDLSAMK